MATQLDQMEKDFIEMKDHLDTMESILQRKKKVVKSLLAKWKVSTCSQGAIRRI